MVLLESNYPLEQEFGVTRTQKLSEMCENAVLQHDLGHLGGGQKVVHMLEHMYNFFFGHASSCTILYMGRNEKKRYDLMSAIL